MKEKFDVELHREVRIIGEHPRIATIYVDGETMNDAKGLWLTCRQ